MCFSFGLFRLVSPILRIFSILHVVTYIHLSLGDVYDEDDDEDDEHEEAPHDGEPDWVRNEREQFKSHRDKNFDGKLDKKEVKEWIIPEDVDHSEEEAKHLIRGSDLNKVG